MEQSRDFFPAKYKLQTQHVQSIYPGQPVWVWTCTIFGQQMRCIRRYKTQSGAWNAGSRWLQKNIHKV